MTTPAAYQAWIDAAAAANGIRPPLLAGLLEHESGWNPNAIGDGGLAKGLGQMHAPAAAEVGADWNVLDDPQVAISATAAYLGKYYKKYGDERTALMCYNQGPTVIGRATAYADAVLALA